MDDLVGIQQSAKKIRNPFGFDFVVTWNKKPIILKGDSQWKTVIGPLRDHIARHLFMKIHYQYHDEQVAALKLKNQDKEARRFSVPASVDNKIWMLITGEPMPNHKADADEDVKNNADLTELRSELKAMEKNISSRNNGPVNVSRILEKATVEALGESGDLNVGESDHAGGSESFSDDVDTTPVDTAPISVDELAPDQSVTPAENVTEDANDTAADTQTENSDEFGDLNNEDHAKPQG